MSGVVSLSSQHCLVVEFLGVAIGSTPATARCFRQASGWRIEDALERFYAGCGSTSSHSPLMGDARNAELDVSGSSFFVGCSSGSADVSLWPVESGVVGSCLPPSSVADRVGVVASHKRSIHDVMRLTVDGTELAAAGSVRGFLGTEEVVPVAAPAFYVDPAALSGCVQHSFPPRGARRRRRTSAQGRRL